MRWIKALFIVVCLISFCALSFAEENANYADCDVCHGAIYFPPIETKALLGIEGIRLAAEILEFKVIKIDLDGVLANGSKDTPDNGFEIQIWGREILYIKDLRDHSLILVVTSGQGTSAADAQYTQRIYLESAGNDEIELTDSIDVAWIKMKHTNIYQWVGNTKNKDEWLALLKIKIFLAMEMLGK